MIIDNVEGGKCIRFSAEELHEVTMILLGLNCPREEIQKMLETENNGMFQVFVIGHSQ